VRTGSGRVKGRRLSDVGSKSFRTEGVSGLFGAADGLRGRECLAPAERLPCVEQTEKDGQFGAPGEQAKMRRRLEQGEPMRRLDENPLGRALLAFVR
jgi:hypothetical protein